MGEREKTIEYRFFEAKSAKQGVGGVSIRATLDDYVTGPGGQSNKRFFANLILFRDVAQLVARLLWEQDVAGSNPVIPTKKEKIALAVVFSFLLSFQSSMFAFRKPNLVCYAGFYLFFRSALYL